MIALGGVAHAQPGQTEPYDPPQTVYVQGALAVGGAGASGGIFGAVAIAGGYHLGLGWWLRGEGLAGKLDDSTWGGPQRRGTIRQLRVGGEWRHRWLYLGIDLGYSSERIDGDNADLEYAGAIIVVRAGLDFGIGVDHLRIRPELELFGGDKLHGQPALGGKDYQGGDTSVALAYIW